MPIFADVFALIYMYKRLLNFQLITHDAIVWNNLISVPKFNF